MNPWASAAVAAASDEVALVWQGVASVTAGPVPDVGLLAGDRPAADVEVLAAACAALEYELARRMHAASASGSLPMPGPGAMLTARAWSPMQARRLARACRLAAAHTSIAEAWAAGLITAEHVDAVARHCEPLTAEELGVVVEQLAGYWGRWSPRDVGRFVAGACRLLHPPGEDPDAAEQSTHESRNLSFALLGDCVLLSGSLTRLEGEAVMSAIDAWADKLRSTVDCTPAGARRADALVELVNQAAASGSLPTRGGLPVALTVSLETTTTGDPVWCTSRGHHLSAGEIRFVACDPTITPVAVPVAVAATAAPSGPTGSTARAKAGRTADTSERPTSANPGAAERIAALARLMLFGTRQPLEVGRSTRIATPAQRRALAVRDRGSVMPGCQIPAENCQTHHVVPWSAGSGTDLGNLALLCWAHHREVDLGRWSIEPLPPGQAASAAAWPANNEAPWIIHRRPRGSWPPWTPD